MHAKPHIFFTHENKINKITINYIT